MWFKNLVFYRLTKPFKLAPEELQQQLERHRAKPCGSLEFFSYGWASPFGKKNDVLVHAANQFIIVCALKEEKVLPASVIREFVTDKVDEIEEKQMRKASKREKEAIRDEVLHDLLPKAFTRSTMTYAYIDPRNDWVVVDSSSPKKAEDLTSLLRHAVGSLPIEPPKINHAPSAVMTEWLTGKAPPDLLLENECELKGTNGDDAIIRCKQQDLTSTEIQQHLNAGKMCSRVAVNWEDKLSFLLCDDFSLKRLRFGDIIQEAVNDNNAETMEEQFDVDFTIMTLELSQLLPRLLELFGGEAQ